MIAACNTFAAIGPATLAPEPPFSNNHNKARDNHPYPKAGEPSMGLIPAHLSSILTAQSSRPLKLSSLYSLIVLFLIILFSLWAALTKAPFFSTAEKFIMRIFLILHYPRCYTDATFAMAPIYAIKFKGLAVLVYCPIPTRPDLPPLHPMHQSTHRGSNTIHLQTCIKPAAWAYSCSIPLQDQRRSVQRLHYTNRQVPSPG